MLVTAKERLKTPLLFPCADRVKIPQIGAEETILKLGQKSSRYAPDSIVFKTSGEPSEPISREYLSRVSADLNFEESVVKERCVHALSYDAGQKYMLEIYDVDEDFIAKRPKARLPVGRHDRRGLDTRHMPCNLTKSSKSHLKPLKRKITERAKQMHVEAIKRIENAEIKSKILEKEKALQKLEGDMKGELTEEDEETDGVFLTETMPSKERRKSDTVKAGSSLISTEKPTKKHVTVSVAPAETVSKMTIKSRSQTKTAAEMLAEDDDRAEKLEKHGNEWDAYALSLISQEAANWLVYEKTPAGSQDREKLENLVKKWYGIPEHTDLVRDEVSDSDESEESKKKIVPKKKWRKKEDTLLSKVYSLDKCAPHELDPYSDDNKAPFYRQPAGLRRARKNEEKEELGAINKTAANIEVKAFKPSPPPSLRDFMNPNVGKYTLDTDNMFQQEQLTGTEQVHNTFGDQSKIMMGTNNKYKKCLQLGFPQEPEDWFPETDEEKQMTARDPMKQRKRVRGLRRWKALPDPIDDSLDTLSASRMDSVKQSDPETLKTAKNNASLRQILDEWRTKWHLSGQYIDSTPDDLIKDMADIQTHVRLKAIATCGKASDYKPPEDPNSIMPVHSPVTPDNDSPINYTPDSDNSDHGIQLEFMEKESTKKLPEKLYVALECLLEDPDLKVKTAAAITLYSLNRPSKPAEKILYKALESEHPVDRWAAAQCLSHFGVCDSDIVGEILQQIMHTEDTIKHERGISMLGLLSISSRLVHCLVAEKLNSSSWRHKIIACKILPTLRGDINRDITNKLTHLMWNDWHIEVRRAAAQCLGKTGHGRDVHDDLCKRIVEGDKRVLLEALSKVGQLGIMTAKLLPAFLKCFDDEYVAIRAETCITAGNLAIKDEEAVSKLVHLATFDNIWKIKALAFQALGKIGVVSEQIKDCLLWAVRYEENFAVRAEACHTLNMLKVKTEEVADVLQDRYLVESNPLVRDELAATLKIFDISLTEDMDMVAQIKREVKKLCTRNIIATQITLNEREDDRKENLSRMIYESQKEMEQSLPRPRKRKKKKRCSITSAIKVKFNHYTHMFKKLPAQQRAKRFKKIRRFQIQTYEEELPPMMERIRSMSQQGSRTSDSATPDVIRDTVFTPTADQELEAILGKAETESGKTSPTLTDLGTTPGTKSRATSLGDEDMEEGDNKEESVKDEEPSHGTQSGDEDPEITKATLERPASTVKFSSHLEVAGIPSRSRSSLGPSSRMSMPSDQGKPSRMSVATCTTGVDGGMVFGRDAVIEREKINEEARNTFAVMDERYQDMVQDLIDLDNAFELGLMNGSRQDFEEKIQGMRVTKTPPSSGNKSKVEITVKESLPGTPGTAISQAETTENVASVQSASPPANANDNASVDIIVPETGVDQLDGGQVAQVTSGLVDVDKAQSELNSYMAQLNMTKTLTESDPSVNVDEVVIPAHKPEDIIDCLAELQMAEIDDELEQMVEEAEVTDSTQATDIEIVITRASVTKMSDC